MTTLINGLWLLGLALALAGFVWSTVRVLHTVGWVQIKRTFLDDPPFLLMLIGALIVIVAAVLSR